jgi:hypothetical protein
MRHGPILNMYGRYSSSSSGSSSAGRCMVGEGSGAGEVFVKRDVLRYGSSGTALILVI